MMVSIFTREMEDSLQNEEEGIGFFSEREFFG
jgi:hypothetical protein